jgi:hypothetical protein
VSYYINGEAAIPKLIELFRMQYDRMTGYGK